MENFDSGELPIISGQAEAISHIYDVYRGKSGFLWLVANNIPNKADAIYMQGRKGSDGFGGATLTFNISHGDKISLSGAWKCEAGKLLQDTGIDVSKFYLGFIVIGRRRGNSPRDSYMRTIVEDVVYIDKEWTVGEYSGNRGRKKAQELANQLNEPLFLYAASTGGTMGVHIKPGNIELSQS